MDGKTMTLEEFTLLARRAELELDAAELQELFAEIGRSCALMNEMVDRVKTRLSASSEPAHIFRPAEEVGDDRR